MKTVLLFLLTTLLISPLFSDYPLIRYTIKSQDFLYEQQQQDVESWYASAENASPLTLFRYVPLASEDLFSVATAFNLPYETLATLNNMDAPVLFIPGKEILVPNRPGLFVPESPKTPWELKLSESRSGEEGYPVLLSPENKKEIKVVFYPGSKFSSEERIRFLGNLFSSPLEQGELTSGFGYRISPFSGNKSFHPGLDLRASIGTPVLAARSGTVSEIGILERYGHYIIIDHVGEYQTVYAHLQEILTKEGQTVRTGDQVALSGNSGISTGPHLHFEIRRNGRPIDPKRITALKN